MDRPILMNAVMVRAVLAGQKTQTRRPLRRENKPAPGFSWRECLCREIDPIDTPCHTCWTRFPDLPAAGDRLWVRETWRPVMEGWKSHVEYEADEGICAIADTSGMERLRKVALRFPGANKEVHSEQWHPSIHMPRWASRITLPLVSVRVERVQDISEADVWAEGITVPLAVEVSGKNWADIPTLHDAWREVWVSIYGQSSWDANHWVWVAEWNKAEVVR